LRQRQIEAADKAGLPSYLWQHDEGLEN